MEFSFRFAKPSVLGVGRSLRGGGLKVLNRGL
jgi:hypothetical protein